MKVLLISISALICITAGNIFYWEKKKKLYERAAIYRNATIFLILQILWLIGIPLILYLAVLNLWTGIIVSVLGFIILRKPLAKIVEIVMLVPIYLLLEKLSKKCQWPLKRKVFVLQCHTLKNLTTLSSRSSPPFFGGGSGGWYC